MTGFVRGSDKGYEFLKLVRYKPHTREEIAHALGWSKRAAHYWVADGLLHGVLVETEAPDSDAPRRRNPPAPKLIALAPAWRGPDAVAGAVKGSA